MEIEKASVAGRVDVGAWGGISAGSNYGVVGFDTRIALMRQGADRPVSLSIRPSFSSLVGPSELWVGNAALDLSMSRALGNWSPYVGVGTSASMAVERSADVNFDPATASNSLAFAGVSYGWKALLLSAEVEKGGLASPKRGQTPVTARLNTLSRPITGV